MSAGRRPAGSAVERRRSALAGVHLAHAHFDAAHDRLMADLVNPDGAPLPLLFGIAGGGKSHLLVSVAAGILDMDRDRMLVDPNLRPVVLVEATPAYEGRFDRKTLLVQILAGLDHPDPRLCSDPMSATGTPARPALSLRDRTLPELTRLVVSALRLHGTRVVLIDEIAHFLGGRDADRTQLSLDTLKYLSNETSTRFLCAGAYDALSLRSVSSQISRRQTQVHLARYRADMPRERPEFTRVAAQLLAILAPGTDITDDLVDLLFRGSLGAVGSLRDWMAKAAGHHTLRGGTYEAALRATMLPTDTLAAMAAQAATGELAVGSTTGDDHAIDGFLGLKRSSPAADAPVTAATTCGGRPRPGDRAPSRDVVGMRA